MCRLLRKIYIFVFIVLGLAIAIYYFCASGTKILLIGLDGASWNIMEPLINGGNLPNIRKLIDTGCSGNLRSFEPMTSPVIWTTIATGKTPEKHGILDFVIKDKESGVLLPVTSNIRKVDAVWNILTRVNKKSIIINYPVTYPAEIINGIMCGLITYGQFLGRLDSVFKPYLKYPLVYPREFSQTFDQLSARASLKFNSDFSELDDLVSVRELTLYSLTKEKKWDLFSVYTNSIDEAQHIYWKYMEPDAFEAEVWDIKPEALIKFGQRIQDVYIETDKFVGEILKRIDKRTILVIVSDHGGGPLLESQMETPLISGGHRINGVIIIRGKNIKRNFQIENARVLDITPTILYLLGLPVAKDMDGRVLKEAVTIIYRLLHPIRYISIYEEGKKREETMPISSPFDEEIIRKLKSLGYIQ